MFKNIFFFSMAVLIPFSASWSQSPGSLSTKEIELPFDLFKYESSTLVAKKFQKFAELDLGGTKVRGQVVQLVYRLDPGNAPLEILENYKSAYTAQGFEVQKDVASGYRAESTGDGRILQLRKAESQSESYIHAESYTVNASRNPKDSIRYFGEELRLLPGQVMVLVQIVTPKSIQNKMVKENASYIIEQLKANGAVQLYGIYFDTDKTDIKAESQPVLQEVSKALRQEAILKLRVVGHTDNTGDDIHNFQLSEGRAKSVVAALVAQGISSDRLVPEGKGSSMPIASNGSEEGRSKNRRVELIRAS